MAAKIFSEEQLNYFRVCHIATDILPPALRLLFKQEWDNRYKAAYGEWQDTPQNGRDFKNGKSPANQRRNAPLLATMINGDRAQWDCTMLFYAIRNSDSVGRGLSSGNPGSGKSQLAGLVAENFYKEARKDTSAPSFVMTLNAENLESLLESYFSLARKVSCPAYTITYTENSKDLNAEQKIAIIKDLISTKSHLYSSWLLVIDNVTNLARMGQFLPKRGNEQWGKGQLLITTQDCSCIPPESPITSHLSISKGMIYTDVANLLFELTGITDDDMGEKVADALDYQPLALASAGVYVRKVRNTNPDFGWEEYLQKLEKGKRERTEEELSKVNNIYPESITEATRIAVKAEVDSNRIMKHAFTFLAFCAPEPVRLHLLTTYVANADALSIKLNKLGPDHVDVASTYHNMAILHKKLGEHQKAKEYYGRALSIQVNKLGPDHVDVASTYHNMGNLHMDLGDHQQAKEYYGRALSIQLNKLGPDHVDVASTYRL